MPSASTLERVRRFPPVTTPPARTAASAPAAAPPSVPRLAADGLTAWYGAASGVRDVTLACRENTVTALIGPYGCGKSTLLRSLNRMHELVPGTRVTGRVLLDGYDIYDPAINPVQVRRRIGMVFQRPTPFPTMTIAQNVAAGLAVGRRVSRADRDAVIEHALRRAALWDEVKDRLGDSPLQLSGGQQQRLCIARAIAVDPEVILMDEPCSALDPIATARIEDLIDELRQNYTIVIVTHNMQQAARISSHTGFLYLGRLIEYGRTADIFTVPREEQTRAYVTGRFG